MTQNDSFIIHFRKLFWLANVIVNWNGMWRYLGWCSSTGKRFMVSNGNQTELNEPDSLCCHNKVYKITQHKFNTRVEDPPLWVPQIFLWLCPKYKVKYEERDTNELQAGKTNKSHVKLKVLHVSYLEIKIWIFSEGDNVFCFFFF